MTFDHSKLRREQDEYVCDYCGKRWATDEEAPECAPETQQEAAE